MTEFNPLADNPSFPRRRESNRHAPRHRDNTAPNTVRHPCRRVLIRRPLIRHSRAGGNPIGTHHATATIPPGTPSTIPRRRILICWPIIRHSRAGGSPIGTHHATATIPPRTPSTIPLRRILICWPIIRHSRAGGNPIGTHHATATIPPRTPSAIAVAVAGP